MKISTQTQTVTTITLEGDREHEMFSGLVDFPLRAQQSEEIEDFLDHLAADVPFTEAAVAGYADVTSF